jgi:hypothetical protein
MNIAKILLDFNFKIKKQNYQSQIPNVCVPLGIALHASSLQKFDPRFDTTLQGYDATSIHRCNFNRYSFS